MVKEIILANPLTLSPLIEFGRPDSTFALKEVELPELKEGQVLLQTILFSNDPGMRSVIQRSWIQKDQNGFPSKFSVRPGDRMLAEGIAKVIKSTSSSIKEGTLVQSFVGWAEQLVADAGDVTPLPDIPGFSPSLFLGVLGLTGMTAYIGLKDFCKLEEGQSIIVSGAAGATGNVAVQLAKYVFKASKVIAIAGSEEKCKWLKKIGADVALNYKSSSFLSGLADAALPSRVDCYFDNVGGSILNACLPLIKKNGRITACGAISTYAGTADKSQTVSDNWHEVIVNRLVIEGFSIIDFFHRRPEALEVLSTALKEGKLSISGGETLIRSSFEEVPEVWMKLFRGENMGKLVTQIADF